MKTINIIKILGIIGLLFLLPSISNAQIQRVWSIAEYTSTMLPPPATGTKVAYRTLNNSLYYWNGSAWIRIAGPGIVDTSYSLSFSSPNLSLLGSGSSVSLTNLYTPGWGLLKTAEEFKVDSSKVASRYYAGTNPTSIANNYVATSNGSNLVARNLFNSTSYAGVIGVPWAFPEWTTAGRPTGANNRWGFNTSNNWLEGYLSATGSYISPLQSSLTGGVGAATRIFYGDANGRATSSGALYLNSDILTVSRGTISAVDIINSTTGYRYRFGVDKSAFSQDVFCLVNLTASNTPFQMYPSGNTVFSPSTLAGGSGQNFETASAGLRVFSKTKGFLTAQMTATQKNAIASAADGLMIYQTNSTKGIWVRDSVAGLWRKLLWGADSTWLKPELEAGRDVDITGGASTDFRIRSNTRVQFDGKLKVGSDSSFVHNPVADTTFIKGSARIRDGDLRIESTTGSPYLIVEAKGGGNKEANIYLKSSGIFSPAIEIDAASGSAGSAKTLNIINYNTDAGIKRVFNFGGELGQFGGRSIGRFTVYDSLELNRKFSFNSNGVAVFDTYGLGNREASDLSKTESSYAAWLMTDGTVGEKSLSTIRDGNGLYTGSGTLANHTTRALIPSTGNLLFSQTYNSTDSAYIQFVNNLDGNREIRGGLTDTASTGFSKFRFYQDEANEEMGWEILTSDGTGTTAVGAQGGNLSLYADAAGTVEVRGQELRLNNGEVSMNQYGQGNMKASDLSATDSKFVAKFGDAGKVLDYYLARDTFIEDVTLFSVGTLMNDCQELTIVSSMTATAPSHQEIRFPDAGDHLRGKKIIVYQKKKEAGIYVPQIKVVGGVSRLYFTTTPGIGGTDPSDQSTLSIDDSTWSSHGTTFEFTCLKIDNTPSYRWVLKQR